MIVRSLTTWAALILAVCLFPAKTFADSPGVVVGHTYNESQTSGCALKRIAYDSEGGKHFAWNQRSSDGGTRDVYYNFIDENGQFLQDGGVPVNTVGGAGYPTVALIGDDQAVVSYHNIMSGYCLIAIDAIRGFGTFTEYDPPDNLPGENASFWPRISVDRNDNIHLTAIEHGYEDPGTSVMYTRSTDMGLTWSDPEVVDTLPLIQAYMTVSSRVDDKSAVVYLDARDVENPYDPIMNVTYVESPDGLTWDFDNNKTTITNYTDADSIYLFTDVDADYDVDGNLHIVWNAYQEHSDGHTSTHLYHWSEPTGITEITSVDYDFDVCTFDLVIAKPSIAIGRFGLIAVVYTLFSQDDVAANGCPNGELYVAVSSDNGSQWEEPWNITNSPSPGCQPGDCDSDHWASTALDRGVVHILYINDKDAGSGSSNTPTYNPVLYHSIELVSAVEEDNTEALPGGFAIHGNYPNPFNASTVISVSWDADDAPTAELSIFNVAGRLIRSFTLDSEEGDANVIWDGKDQAQSDVASGIYFYRLRAGEKSVTRSMTLLR